LNRGRMPTATDTECPWMAKRKRTEKAGNREDRGEGGGLHGEVNWLTYQATDVVRELCHQLRGGRTKKSVV